MTDSEKIEALEQRIKELENIINLLSSNNEKDVLKNTLSSAPKIISWDFTDNFNLQKSGWVLDCALPKEAQGCFAFEIDASPKPKDFADPKFLIHGLDLNAGDIKYIHLRFKADLDTNGKGWYNNNVFYNAYIQFYFKTSSEDRWSQSRSFSAYYCSGEVVDMYIETKHELWKDKITSLRFDSSEKLTGSVEVYLIELLGEANTSGVGKWMRDVSNKLVLFDERISELESRSDDFDDYMIKNEKV